ncbi:hypothetical protein [Variovorax sp. GB1P17]|uniref:hypothetical protein n=1 Tax=Variovorax sp. GB1P17 TaxID=3443740 RepID=UPI003F489A7A
MSQGLRLKFGERPQPMRVTVMIRDSDRDKNNSGRNLVEAMLFENWGLPQARSAGRISDPVILPFKGSGFLLSGIELDSHADGIAEHRQVWLVVPVERSS